MTFTTIEKRDGTIVAFDKNKITNAILKAMKNVNKEDKKEADNIATQVVKELNKNKITQPDVEMIQDIVEKKLMKKLPNVAKAYITYREKRTRVRELKSGIMIKVKNIIGCNNIQNSNANVDEYSFGGRKKESSDEIQRELALNELIDPKIAQAHRDGRLYIHDLSEYAVGMHNCLFADTERLLNHGFKTRNGDVRPAGSFSTACQLLAVIFQVQSQCQFGR